MRVTRILLKDIKAIIDALIENGVEWVDAEIVHTENKLKIIPLSITGDKPKEEEDEIGAA